MYVRCGGSNDDELRRQEFPDEIDGPYVTWIAQLPGYQLELLGAYDDDTLHVGISAVNATVMADLADISGDFMACRIWT